MGCNKVEAIYYKKICDEKLAEKDFIGAKKFAQKANELFIGLEGIPQLLRILDIYISSEKEDWYDVLGVGPTSDDETIKNNFNKLACYLHPDENKIVGAEGAFKLVLQAWTLLSNNTSRKLYDQKRPVNITKPVRTIRLPNDNPTFWASCLGCLMRYKYSYTYINKLIYCPKCGDPFWAIPVWAIKAPEVEVVNQPVDDDHDEGGDDEAHVKQEQDPEPPQHDRVTYKTEGMDLAIDCRIRALEQGMSWMIDWMVAHTDRRRFDRPPPRLGDAGASKSGVRPREDDDDPGGRSPVRRRTEDSPYV